MVPVIANVTAERATEPSEIRDLLVRQVTGMVRWRESMLASMAMGVDSFVELGAGKVLSGLARRIKRVTFGLEPSSIASLLREREALLHGIREGMLGLDVHERITVINEEAARLLQFFGAETRIFDPSDFPFPDQFAGDDHPATMLESIDHDAPPCSINYDALIP